MTEFTEEKLAELRAVAEAATEGPWVFDPPGMWGDEDDIPQSAVRQLDSGSITWDDHGGEVFKPEDAYHIATFDPPTVLALIAALEAKTYEAQRLREIGQGLIKQRDKARAEAAQWEAEARDMLRVDIPALKAERDDARAALKAKDSYVGDLEEQLKHIKSLWRATGRAEADAHRRAETAEQERDEARKQLKYTTQQRDDWASTADRAEAAIERVREAATEVTNQGDNHGRTHYEGCWKHHLHCLAAKIIYETGGDDD